MKTSYLMNKTFHFSFFIYIKLNDEDIDYFISLFKPRLQGKIVIFIK